MICIPKIIESRLIFLADVIVVDRIHHLHSFTDSPPNEFCLRDSFAPGERGDDDDDQSIMEKTHVNMIEEPIQTLPTKEEPTPTIEKMSSSNDKENKVPERSMNMTVSTITLNPTNDPSLDGKTDVSADYFCEISLRYFGKY